MFQKSKTQTVSSSLSPHPQEFIFARSCMYEGADLIQKFRDKFKRVREQIDLLANNNKTVVIWAANKVCCMLLENYQLPKSAIIIDSDPRKSTYFHPLIVYQPQQVLEQIASADLLVINSKRHSDSIQAWIKKHTNRHFSEENLAILDYHFIGD